MTNVDDDAARVKRQILRRIKWDVGTSERFTFYVVATLALALAQWMRQEEMFAALIGGTVGVVTFGIIEIAGRAFTRLGL
jgi:hypothetical protein